MKTHLIGLAALAALASGCIVVAGTQDFEEGGGGSGGGGGDGGAGGSGATTTGTSSSTGTGGGTGSTGTGGGCVDLTVNVAPEIGDVKVDLDPGAGDFDFKYGDPPTECVPPGARTLSAECDGEEDKYAIAVDWGYEPCGVATTCSFDLSTPMTFHVTGANCQ